MNYKVMFLANKDNVLFNFRSEVILRVKELGCKVILSCPYGFKIDYFTERGCEFIHMDMNRRGTSVFEDLRLLKEYYKLIKKEKPDIVLTYTSKPSIYAGFICGLLHIPYIVNNAGLMETSGWLEKIMKILYRIGFRKASCIMFQNDLEKDYINNLLKNRVYNRRIPGSGVNLNSFCYKPYPEEKDGIIFNYVARIVALKGINEFLECATRIKAKYRNVRFIIYGDYDDDIYRSKIQELEHKGIVEYGGIQMDMKPCIEKAHAVIHPSYYEGMTNVVLEHSAMGRVCIGSDIPGIREGIENGVTGYLFEVKNVDSMVNCVEKFINLPFEEKVTMGYKARQKMEKEFSRDIVVNTYVEEMSRIMNLRKKQ